MNKYKRVAKQGWGASIGIILGILAIRSVLADQYVIPSGSMEPTIQVGDHVIVNKAAYGIRIPFTRHFVAQTGEPERGEVIVFEDPRDPSRTLIKRLIGLPGDHVSILNGLVSINGTPLRTLPNTSPQTVLRLEKSSNPFVYQELAGMHMHSVQRIPQLARAERREIQVPAGQYLFLGDNRDNSADGRVFGWVPRELLRGRAMRIAYNLTWDGLLPKIQRDRTGLSLDAS